MRGRRKTVAERAEILGRAAFEGGRCVLRGGVSVSAGKREGRLCPSGPITATVCLPNDKTPECGSMRGLVESLAKVVALEQAKKRMQKQPAGCVRSGKAESNGAACTWLLRSFPI
jgi:hypothetical protein